MLFSRSLDNELKATLVSLVTQVSESKQYTKEAIARTREDIRSAVDEIKALETSFIEVKTQLARSEGLGDDVKILKKKSEYLEERVNETTREVETLRDWQQGIIQGRQEDIRVLKDKTIDYLIKAVFACLLAGVGFFVWNLDQHVQKIDIEDPSFFYDDALSPEE